MMKMRKSIELIKTNVSWIRQKLDVNISTDLWEKVGPKSSWSILARTYEKSGGTTNFTINIGKDVWQKCWFSLKYHWFYTEPDFLSSNRHWLSRRTLKPLTLFGEKSWSELTHNFSCHRITLEQWRLYESFSAKLVPVYVLEKNCCTTEKANIRLY